MSLPYRGAAATLLLGAVLLTPPTELVEREGAYADTTGVALSADAVPVKLLDGLTGDVSSAIPWQLGEWKGGPDPDWTEDLSTYLGYDSLLVRDYLLPGLYVPVQLLVITARQAGAFHDPTACLETNSGRVHPLAVTTVDSPASEGPPAPVGRFLVTYPEAPARLVYSLYVVENHLAAPHRVTWVRLLVDGVDPDAPEAFDAPLAELLARVVPHLFQGAASERTTLGWVSSQGGPPAALGAVLATLAPVGIELAWLRGRKG